VPPLLFLRDFHEEAFGRSASSFDLVEDTQLMQRRGNVAGGLREVFLCLTNCRCVSDSAEESGASAD
jgi:hypothetical protein